MLQYLYYSYSTLAVANVTRILFLIVEEPLPILLLFEVYDLCIIISFYLTIFLFQDTTIHSLALCP